MKKLIGYVEGKGFKVITREGKRLIVDVTWREYEWSIENLTDFIRGSYNDWSVRAIDGSKVEIRIN